MSNLSVLNMLTGWPGCSLWSVQREMMQNTLAINTCLVLNANWHSHQCFSTCPLHQSLRQPTNTKTPVYGIPGGIDIKFSDAEYSGGGIYSSTAVSPASWTECCICDIAEPYIHNASNFDTLSWKCKIKVKASHTDYRSLGLELIPVYRQSARRWL